MSTDSGQRDGEALGRRRFLGLLTVATAGLTAALVGVPVIGFVLAPLFREKPDVWRAVGRLEQFALNETVQVNFDDPSSLPWAGITSRSGAWLRRTGQSEFVAYSIHCTHLGCPIRWLASAEIFMCPCHGGVFYSDGSVAAGPPPEPLAQLQVRVRNGDVEVRTAGVPVTGSLPGSA